MIVMTVFPLFRKLESLLPGCNLVDVGEAAARIRMVKSREEIEVGGGLGTDRVYSVSISSPIFHQNINKLSHESFKGPFLEYQGV